MNGGGALALSCPSSLTALPIKSVRSRSRGLPSSSFLSSRELLSLGNVRVVRLWKCRAVRCARTPVFLDLPKKVAVTSLDATQKTLTRTLTTIGRFPCHVQCVAAAGVIAFALWGLLPSIHFIRRNVFQRREWDKSRTKFVLNSYVKPVMLWVAIIGLCRALDPVILSSAASQAVKERFLNFLRALSTVLTFAFCTARMTQQVQRLMMDRHNTEDSRNLGIRFIGSAVSTSVWVAAVCLFMELLGFSTQKWLTAGGFGTVLLTLAGREIFTNFLSSVMIHATRPFVEYEWIQTKIDGQEVSGTVEHVGWWSPTVIRGEDREAVHIPNHKFTMSVVRNLSQKSHWRVKTYIGLSHLDASKIHLIVADMRKVLSKHPQVEHRRLHRRVFFDNIDPSNQSLMIMVSCFVKTSHYEEYLSVKEIILLNLLKVISHHNARLATPIRSIQRIYDEAETRQSPFRNVSNEDGRPLLLIEASAVAAENGNVSGKSKQEATSTIAPVEATRQDREGAQPSPKTSLEGLDSMGLNAKDMSLLGAAFEKPSAKISDVSADSKEPKLDEQKRETAGKTKQQTKQPNRDNANAKSSKPSLSSKEASPSQKRDLKLEKSNDGTAKTKSKPAEMAKDGNSLKKKEQQADVEDDPWKDQSSTCSTSSSTQNSDEQQLKRSPSNLEDNLVLGVALAGSKRTLPLSSGDGDDDEKKLTSDPDTTATTTTRSAGSGKTKILNDQRNNDERKEEFTGIQ